MSSERNDYVILGYDLTIYMDTIYDDWSEDEENIDKWCATNDSDVDQGVKN